MKILVVDDEKDVQLLFELRFRREIKSGEVTMVFALSGQEALDYLKVHVNEGILILSDINMPGMNGLELLKHIKEDFENPPPVVMMITAYGDDDNFQMAKGLGAEGFLTKPVDFAELKEKLKSWAV